MNNLNYLVFLHYIWISQKFLNIIFRDNSNYKDFYENFKKSDLINIGIKNQQINYIFKSKTEINFINILNKLKSRNVKIITKYDKQYPDNLKEIFNPPYFFYLRWTINSWAMFSVVWSRKITTYWIKSINNIVSELSNKFIIVSWWAAWCDTYAHKTALNNWKSTISIIWTWIDIDYPVWNNSLYNEIVNNWGGVISIFPIWERWNPYNFPIRNEIVAWLSVWVLVIEAQKRSGTIITAKLALDLWKDLFAIPWDIFNLNSVWCNMLIKRSMAKLVSSSNDIFEDYNIWVNNSKQQVLNFDDENHNKIYNILLLEKLNTDELSKKLWIKTNNLINILSMMEINWLIKKSLWWKYDII
jgi:DNA processing protein